MEFYRRARSANLRLVTSIVFGLIHGFGFASALTETGLASAQLVPALLGFNLGIELGQIAIITAIWVLLQQIRQSRLLNDTRLAVDLVLSSSLWVRFILVYRAKLWNYLIKMGFKMFKKFAIAMAVIGAIISLVLTNNAPESVYRLFPGYFEDPNLAWETSPLTPQAITQATTARSGHRRSHQQQKL